MRSITLAAAVVVAAVACVSCGGASTPVSPTVTAQPAVAADNGTPPAGTPVTGAQAAAPIGLTGVVRGLNVGRGIFSLVSRAGTRTILTDSDTQVWNKGTRVRLSSLRDGQSVSIRGYDHQRYVLARTIGVN
ncbi:MAG: hypothetical protein AB1806_06355 [Acidobacteriota bacterium]